MSVLFRECHLDLLHLLKTVLFVHTLRSHRAFHKRLTLLVSLAIQAWGKFPSSAPLTSTPILSPCSSPQLISLLPAPPF